MKTIIVATDFSSPANNAVKYAAEFAAATNHALFLMHAYVPSVSQYSPVHAIIAEETRNETNRYHKKLDSLVKKITPVKAETFEAVGDPVTEILNAGKVKKANFIVVGTHGASGVRSALFGSNTSKIIVKAELPVLAIPPRYKFKKTGTIVYASDLKNTINELKVLVPIAKLLNASIEIVYLKYAWDKNPLVRADLEKKIKALRYKNISFVEQKAAIEIPMSEQLKSYVKKRKPELLAMFPADKSWFDKFFTGSKTEDIAFELKVPLLSIRKNLVQTD
jgi:nucleotide-binding universal stress UspA family protein